jgi:hypothetical protein
MGSEVGRAVVVKEGSEAKARAAILRFLSAKKATYVTDVAEALVPGVRGIPDRRSRDSLARDRKIRYASKANDLPSTCPHSGRPPDAGFD